MIDEKKLIERMNKCGIEFLSRYYTNQGIIDIFIDLVEEEAEEQSEIGSWIPCSDRLPTMEECQKNDCRFILDDGNRRYQGLFDYTEKRFVYFNCEGTQTDKCVIAWQQLPEPYKAD